MIFWLAELALVALDLKRMKSRRLLHLSLLLGWLPSFLAAEGLTIDHNAIACIVAGRFPRLDARIAPAEQLARARAFFHADDDARWYYVDMKAEAGAFHGVLPAPLKSTKRIHYYIEATDKSVAQALTQEYAATVVPDAGACGNKGMVAAMAVASKVVVGVPAGASAAPAGFAANTVAAAGGAVGGGISTTAVVIGAVAVVGGAGAAVAAGGGGPSGTGSSPPPQDTSVHFVDGIVYNDACCPAGLIDPTSQRTARRIQGAAVSSSLDSATTSTDGQGFFHLVTQTRCQNAPYTLRIVAAGCDPLSVPRDWGCVGFGGPGGIPHALNLICR